MKINAVPHVSGMCVGFMKESMLAEYDCPHCGHEHIVRISPLAAQPLRMITPCNGCVELHSLIPAEYMSDGD